MNLKKFIVTMTTTVEADDIRGALKAADTLSATKEGRESMVTEVNEEKIYTGKPRGRKPGTKLVVVSEATDNAAE